jgi:hypothetical protein
VIVGGGVLPHTPFSCARRYRSIGGATVCGVCFCGVAVFLRPGGGVHFCGVLAFRAWSRCSRHRSLAVLLFSVLATTHPFNSTPTHTNETATKKHPNPNARTPDNPTQIRRPQIETAILAALDNGGAIPNTRQWQQPFDHQDVVSALASLSADLYTITTTSAALTTKAWILTAEGTLYLCYLSSTSVNSLCFSVFFISMFLTLNSFVFNVSIGLEVVANGSPEARLYEAIQASGDLGLTKVALELQFGKAMVKIGLGPCMKNKWLQVYYYFVNVIDLRELRCLNDL